MRRDPPRPEPDDPAGAPAGAPDPTSAPAMSAAPAASPAPQPPARGGRLPLAAAVVSCALLGAMVVPVKRSALPSDLLVASRLAVGAAFLGGLWVLKAATGAGMGRLGRSGLAWACLSGGCLVSAMYCYFNAVRLMDPSVAGVLLFSAPLPFVALAPLALGERVGARGWAALALCTAGLLLVTIRGAAAGGGGPGGAGPGGLDGAGLAWGLGAALSYALFLVANRRNREAPILSVCLAQQAFGAAAALAWGALVTGSDPARMLEAGWLEAVAFGVAFGGVGLGLVTYASARMEARSFGAVSYLEPAVIVLCGWLFLGEAMTPAKVAGILLILGGCELARRGPGPGPAAGA